MRCMCRECGTYMVQAEDGKLGCICPECFNRCRDCLGTDSVMSREELAAMKEDPALAAVFLMRRRDENEENEDR
ncbi:MAG: endonuclease Q family protein [Clostridiales bacterium]|nr:endonuclease Q family protein [Clostridiales bacterium]